MQRYLLFIFLLPTTLFSQSAYQYKNLALEGGGVRGLAYAGAIEVLEQKNIIKNIERVAGSSAGAIAGLMISLGYNSVEIDSVLQNLKVQQFNDGKDIVGKIIRIKKEYGLFKGNKFEKWIGKLIEYKTGDSSITFSDLHKMHLADNTFKDFYCTGTNISRQQLEIFSYETWPQMQLKTAVHISSCIPFYFKPVAIDSVGNEIYAKKVEPKYDLYVDGGMLCNFPINMFDTSATGHNPLVSDDVKYNYETLGLKLEREKQVEEFEDNKTTIAPYQVKSMKDYTSAVMNLMMEKLNRNSADLSNEKGRTIYISYGEISGRIRKMSSEEKKILHDNGVAAATQFFNSATAAH
ncbi:MAG: patatin-like phospholipase family protein [Bacteroidota bacterium]|nr:patatin-like phospholipase family protein [Bacteroidota bacterium]